MQITGFDINPRFGNGSGYHRSQGLNWQIGHFHRCWEQSFQGSFSINQTYNKNDIQHHPQCCNFSQVCSLYLSATVNQHPPVHPEGWMMVSGQETVFCCVPVPSLTMVVSSVVLFYYLPTNNPQVGCGLLVAR
jgi:hypothetical protein